MARSSTRPDSEPSARRPERADPPAPPEEIREVRVADPHLSEKANRALTGELRETLGTDQVRVPADRPHPSRGETPNRSGFAASLGEHRLLLVRTFLFAVVFGLVIALITGSWVLVPIVIAIHILGAVVVTTLAVGLMTNRERPSPETVAQLAEEGVHDPERHFSELVEEFTPQNGAGERPTDASAAADVATSGHNARRVDATEHPAQASAEQSAAWTPTSGPSEPAPAGGTPDAILWGTILGLAVLSIVIPLAFGGGGLWLVSVIMLPLLLVWVVLQLRSAGRSDA